MSLSLHNVSCGYTRKPVLTQVNLDVREGDFLCLLGPNGSGKSALLKTIAGLLPPREGTLLLRGKAWGEWTARERATQLAYVPQAHAPLFAFSVLDVVAMGRTARWPLWAGPGRSDWAAARSALALVEMSHFAERPYTELSGGERQMILIARALAQEARLLVLDEPASSLDYGNQVRMLLTLRRLVREGFGVIMATHQPDHALRCASRICVIQNQQLRPPAPPSEILTADFLEEVYRVPFVVASLNGRDGQPFPLCAPSFE